MRVFVIMLNSFLSLSVIRVEFNHKTKHEFNLADTRRAQNKNTILCEQGGGYRFCKGKNAKRCTGT